jgi:chromosome segregation ATPase
MSENNIENIKQEIAKIDQLIVKKQKEMNELQKVLMIEPAKINILGDTYEDLRNEIKELGEKLKEHKQTIQKN